MTGPFAVANPNSRTEWATASHHVDRLTPPLVAGDTFRQRRHTRGGEVLRDWVLIKRDHQRLRGEQTQTDFIGLITVPCKVELATRGHRYRSTLINPARSARLKP